MSRPPAPVAALALLLLLAACGKKPSEQEALDRLDDQLTETPGSRLGDPAVAAAVNAPIMTDPALGQSANADAIRPPNRPDPLSVPPDTLGARPDPVDAAKLRRAPAAKPCAQCGDARASLTLGALAEKRNMPCAADIRYGAAWANRLPADLPLYPDARVVEAAGNDAGNCRLRVVSFTSSAGVGKLVDWYYTRLTAAHYSAEHQADGREHVLGGTRGEAAYMLYAKARADGGTDVDLVVNGG